MGNAPALARDDAWLARFEVAGELMYAVRRLCPRLPLLATSVVHPRNRLADEHFELLAALAGDDTAALPSSTLVAREWLRCVLSALRATSIAARVRMRFGRRVRKTMRDPAAVVMKTWCFGPDGVDPGADFYYGDLGVRLQGRVDTLLLCGDARGGDQVRFARTVLGRHGVRAIPEWALVPLWAPLMTAFSQLRTSLQLRRLGRDALDRRLATVCGRAALDCLTPSTNRNVMWFYIARAAIRDYRAGVLMTLYEGNPWEKLAWHGAKEASSSCLTVGYQHTIIKRHSLSLTRPNTHSWELSTPDVVLCLGDRTRDLMADGHAGSGAELVSFGSLRRSQEDPSSAPPTPEQRTVLVVPEGHLTECQLLFDFAFGLAAERPDHRFILRCHPMRPFAEIRPHLRREQPDNVEVSREPSLQADCARSSVVVYRGSSAVLSAVWRGLKPIYVHDPDQPDIDALFEMTEWRERVASTAEAAALLERYSAMDAASVMLEWQVARDYVESYSMPADDGSISRFLAAVGLSVGDEP